MVKIRAGSFSAALSEDNELFIWGKSAFGEFILPHRVRSVSDMYIQDFNVSTGGMIIILSNGSLYSWGDNKYGQLGLGDHESRISPTEIKAL